MTGEVHRPGDSVRQTSFAFGKIASRIVAPTLLLLLLPSVAFADDYTVRKGDTLTLIAKRNMTTVEALEKANGIKNPDLIYVGQRIRIAPATSTQPARPAEYTVKKGDTLSSIAERSQTTVEALGKANGIGNPDLIYVGQRIRIVSASPTRQPKPAGPVKVGGAVFPVAGFRSKVPTHWNGHPGAADLFARMGTPVYSIVSGIVVDVSSYGMGGNNVMIRGVDGKYYYYAHLKEYPLVREGAAIKAGTRLGTVGDTGNAVGRPHLHLAIGDRITTGNGDGRGGYGIGFDVPSFLNRLIEAGAKR